MFTVTITDELGFSYGYECEPSEVAGIVKEWMDTVGETPIDSIVIEPSENT
jgi:hypothetical protein